jgi:hypothetical protein
VMHFYPGTPMHLFSGVDSCPGWIRFSQSDDGGNTGRPRARRAEPQPRGEGTACGSTVRSTEVTRKMAAEMRELRRLMRALDEEQGACWSW